MANIAQTVNVLQAIILTEGEKMVLTPTYYVFDLYKAHMDKVAADGMEFTDPTGTYHLDGFKTAYSADEIGIVDIAIIMVKATQTEGLLEKSKACIGPETVVVTLQNGLGNDEHVKKFVPADRILFGCGNMGTELSGPGA